MNKLKSRKLWVTILATLLGAVYPDILPLLKIVAPAYLVAEGGADFAGALAAGKKTE